MFIPFEHVSLILCSVETTINYLRIKIFLFLHFLVISYIQLNIPILAFLISQDSDP